MNNVFMKKWPVFVGEEMEGAWKFSNDIYASLMKDGFVEASVEHFFLILKNYKINEYGLIDICPDVQKDREARVALWYMPTYALIAMYVWLENQGTKFDEETKLYMFNLMESAFTYGIVGHGFDADEMLYKTMMILAKAGSKEFIAREPEFSPRFTTAVVNGIAQLECDFLQSETKKYEEYFGWRPKRNELQMVVNAWHGRSKAIFVYGTLMNGEKASYMLEKYEYCGQFCLKNYAMYNVSSFPGIRKKKGECVVGEVYFVDDACLEVLDKYESEGSLYKRKLVKVESAHGNIEAYTYIFNQNCEGNVIRNKWNVKPDSKIWYACYGSNLSEERFRLYIEGGYFTLTDRNYRGCSNKNLWEDTDFTSFPGRLYFGNCSASWFNSGVAFLDLDDDYRTYMRLYKITWEQLLDIQAQEGMSSNWYGRRVCLGIHEDGCPIYTFTSETKREEREPYESYIQLIREALVKECGVEEKMVNRYLKKY